MDRQISNSVKRKQKLKQALKILMWGLAFVVIIIALRVWLKPSINYDGFETAIAETGNIEASITASGTVFPEFEEIITSPIQSRIVRIYHNTGNKVNNGDRILSLDTRSTGISLEKLKDELNMKINNVTQLKLRMEKNLIDLKTHYEIKKLQVENLETELEEEKYLQTIGGGTKERVERAKLNLKISRLELEQIKQNIENLEKSNQADLQGLNYEINIHRNNVNELKNKLERSSIRAYNEGVITWINDQIGGNINPGDELVKIANLQSYEVTGSIPDRHADKLYVGGEVIVRINENNNIRGEIVSISPSVTGNIIQFKVSLSEKGHALLRPNLKVDVFVITSFKEDVIRVANRAFYRGAVRQPVFVVKGNKLIRREATFGDSNFDFVEVVEGIDKGDEVVVSDMSDYMRHEEIDVKSK